MSGSHGRDQGGGDPDDFDSLLGYVEREMDFASSHYNDSYLDRRITARMSRTGVDDYGEYRQTLERDPGERAALMDALSINVTGFFRNPEVWEDLRPILRELTDGLGATRAWSAPCSDGREPYSLAMLALSDPEVSERRLDVLASDISEDALETARRGVYRTSQTDDIEDELGVLDDPSPYVRREGDRYRVADRVRDLVTTERHDLIRDPPKGDMDLVLCRNLIIYIDEEYKQPIFETLHGSIREGGYLVIGKTERLPRAFRSAFDPVAKSSRIYRKV